MKKLAVVYHSSHGHTAHIADHVAEGAKVVPNIELRVIKAEELTVHPEEMLKFDGYLFGSPTYLEGVSGPFKSIMDATGALWRTQQLKGKLAAGFTVSSLPAGDKQWTLVSMFVFSMQHGMIWVGNPILPEQHRGVPYDEAANRLGSWSGLMVQAGHSSPADSFVSGDIKTARMFGRNFSETLHRIIVAPRWRRLIGRSAIDDPPKVRTDAVQPDSFSADVALGVRGRNASCCGDGERRGEPLGQRMADCMGRRVSGGYGCLTICPEGGSTCDCRELKRVQIQTVWPPSAINL